MSGDGEESAASLSKLGESVEAHPQDPSLRLQLGILLWENGGEFKDKAAQHFLIAAKLDPHNASAFRYLGHYYAKLDLHNASAFRYYDSERAVKCYQRAVTLDPLDSECGEALCDMLDSSAKVTLEMAVCREASQKSTRAFWAFRRLGYLLLHHNNCSEAVQNLQQAIRGYPTCAHLWESLGLAYQRLGMFSAATKSYGRAVELDTSRIFSLVQSGNIFLILGSFRKGVEQFQQAVRISPQNVSANYGLASALLGLSKECINTGAFRWGASLLEEACNIADICTSLSGRFSCVWKLHGDILLTYAKCFPWMEGDQSIEFGPEYFKTSILSWNQTRISAAISARRSYQRALHLAPWQANLYIDIAITSDLISSMEEIFGRDTSWQLSEKMALGALLLEGQNQEFWVALGCLASHISLKQHSFVRGLQLDVSLAAAWAYLGKFYREEGEKKVARQAFDCARSIDPSLALPWAGMSADSHAGIPTPDETFESCLRAVQILPVAEFQIGLAKLALISGHIASSQVFIAIQQAIQRAPQCPESHNLNGLVCEARLEFEAAIVSYRLARFATFIFSGDPLSRSRCQDISINLSRSLCQAGHFADAVKECEYLKKAGILHAEGMHIYALSLWKLGKKDLAICVAKDLAVKVSSMEQNAAASSVGFICRLLYYVSGMDAAINKIFQMPKSYFQCSKVRLIVCGIHALDQNNRLNSVVSSDNYYLSSQRENHLMALGKLVKHGSGCSLGYQSAISYLRKALHAYPNSNMMRNLLGYLLLSSDEWEGMHVASRCCVIDSPHETCEQSLKPGYEILGGGAVACYAIGNKNPRFSFPTCSNQCLNGPTVVQELQRYLHQEPWNCNAKYLLILNLLQKAREERFPQQLCVTLERLIFSALSNDLYNKGSTWLQYQKFQFLLCASEVSLQCGNLSQCLKHVKEAASLPLPNNYLFFGSLLLCRAYAAESNYTNLQEEYRRCLELKTDSHIGWICLKIVESQYSVQIDANVSPFSFKDCLNEWNNSWTVWMAIFNLVLGLTSLWNKEYFSAEESFAQACTLGVDNSCFFLCHGATSMELARQFASSQFLSIAIRSLNKARENSLIPLPVVSLLLAQAEGSLGSKEKWKKNLRLEWYSWPPEMRPAELFFQMHLLVRELDMGFDSSSGVEFCQTAQQWVLRAIHTNPSCLRYWKVLSKLTE